MGIFQGRPSGRPFFLSGVSIQGFLFIVGFEGAVLYGFLNFYASFLLFCYSRHKLFLSVIVSPYVVGGKISHFFMDLSFCVFILLQEI
jgi:hypothetical protein